MKHLSTRFFSNLSALVLLLLTISWVPEKAAAQSISVNGSLTTFFANPGTNSPVQSYTVSATGLNREMVITTPLNQHFQVSLNGNTWSSSLSLSVGQINNKSVTIFVRYAPPIDVSSSTNNGLITHESTGAETQSISVTGRNKPTIRLTGTFTKVLNQVTGVPSAGQQFMVEGNLLAGDIIIDAPDYFQVSKEQNSGYGNSVAFPPTAGSVNSTFWVRFNPHSNFLGSLNDIVLATSPSANFTFIPVEGNAIATEPTVRSTLAIGAVGANSIEVTFTGGNGARRLVVARLASTTAAFPLDARNYVANTAFGSGEQTGFGNSVVYSNNGNAVTVTGLDPGTEYRFDVYEFNNGGVAGAENYLTPAASISAFTEQQALPITLLSFAATLSSEKLVNVNWTTASEVNNERFEVERSKDGVTFEGVGTLAGAGTVNERRDYRLVDAKPLVGTSYYRLRQVDYDGTTAYSKTVAVRNTSRLSRPVNLYPNPVVNTDLRIDLGFAAKNVKVQVVDMLGRVVLNESAPRLLSEETLSLDLSRLNAGTYQLTILSEEGNITRKFIKADR
jgi:trimeric autotransporter adhesin